MRTDKATSIGFNMSDPSLFHLENNCIQNTPATTDKREVLSIKTALKKAEFKKLSWKLVDKEKDEITKAVFHAEDTDGYFIRSFKQEKRSRETETVSVTTCLSTTQEKFTQNVHNIIIAEENSDLTIITGCITPFELETNLHKGITEIYVRKNAKLTFTMVHAWSTGSIVQPRTAVYVEEGGTFISNYVLLSKVAKLDTNPQITLAGVNSSAILNSFIYSFENSDINLGGGINLKGENSTGIINSNIVVNGGHVINTGTLSGEAKGIKAHLECNAIILNPKANSQQYFETVPILKAYLPDLDMSHEASIGKLNNDEIEYLQSKGLNRKKAEKLIIGGFIDKSLQKIELPFSLDIQSIIDASENGI